MKTIDVKKSDEQFKAAEKRHEDKFEEELKNVDIRAVVLKTKKALLEQARVSARVEQAAIDQMYKIKDLDTALQSCVNRLNNTENKLHKQQKVFTEAIILLSKEKKKKGFFNRLIAWMK